MLKGSSVQGRATFARTQERGNELRMRTAGARTSRVAAEDNQELNCFWSGNSLCSLQYVAGKGVPLFIGSNAKFACTAEREPPSELWAISDVKRKKEREREREKKQQRPRLSSNAIHLCASCNSVRELRNFGFRFRIRFINLSWSITDVSSSVLPAFSGFNEWPKLVEGYRGKWETLQLRN